MLCTLLVPTNITAAELFKSLNDYISGKLNWSFYVGICTDGVAATTGQLSGFTTHFRGCFCVIHREMLDSRKMSPELNNILQDVIKIINHIKHMPVTHICSRSSVRRWTQSTHVFSYTQE